jgi:hypothetical protein
MIAPDRGAATPLHLASSPAVRRPSPAVAGVTGKYFVKRREARSSPASYDAGAARALWQISERLAPAAPRSHPPTGS